MMPTLALCIPAYNASWSLPALFESVSKQAVPFNEILLYNDCSTDDTALVAAKFGATVINGKVNIGCSAGKNELAAHAKSEWLFFLDSDDELLPGFTTAVLNALCEKTNADMLLLGYLNRNTVTGEVRQTLPAAFIDLQKDAVEYMIKNKVVNSSVIKRNSFNSFGGFDTEPEILYIEDRAYSLKCAMAGLQFGMIAEPLFIVNFYPQSMSGRQPAKWIEAAVSLWKKTYAKTGNAYGAVICLQLFENAVWAAKYSEWRLVKKSLKLASSISPHQRPVASPLFSAMFGCWPFGAYLMREILLRIYTHKTR